MQVKEVATKHGVPIQRVLSLLDEAGVSGKEPASTLTEAELHKVEGRLSGGQRRPTPIGANVKVVRSSSQAPIVRKPSPTRPGGAPASSSATAADASKPAAKPRTDRRREGAPSPERGEARRAGADSKARELLRTKRMREAGIKLPAGEVAPPPTAAEALPAAPQPVTEEAPPREATGPTEAQIILQATHPVFDPPQPTSTEPSIADAARSAIAQQRADQTRSRPQHPPRQQGGGGRSDRPDRPRPQGGPGQGQGGRPGGGGGGDRSQQRPTRPGGPRPGGGGGSRPDSRGAGGQSSGPGAKPSAPPPAPGEAVKGKRPKPKNTKEQMAQERKDREKSVVERKVLASIMGNKKGKKQSYRRTKRERFAATAEAERVREEKERTTLRIHEATTVADVAHGLDVNPSEILKMLLDLGRVVTVNQHIDRESIDLIAEEFGFDVEETSLLDINPFEEFEQIDEPDKLLPRPPVVTVMGHVDHGKTKLMDAIRSADVASGEAGGITQHIGAYFVQLDQGPIAFLDTPGHEAFTAMRARGAMVTDVVVLVVAADDGVMPQTREAIAHARAADVPIIVAINKVDLPAANVDKVKQELAAEGLTPEDWGGKTPIAEISALKKIGITQLVELIHLQAELLELKANPDKRAKGTIVEARLEQGRGSIATALVQEGTLRIGDPIVAGVYSGKVRALMDDHGNRITEAGPGLPVAILGLSGTPVAGDELRGVPDEKTARDLAGKLQQIRREREMARTTHVTLESLFSRIEEGSVKDLNLVIRGDVQGSVEALAEAVQRIESTKVKVRILHRGVGPVSASDVMLASASDAIVIGFNVPVPPETVQLKQQEGVDIRTYQIIYDAVDDIKKAMLGLLADEVHEVILGRLKILQIFRSSKQGVILGGTVMDGKLVKNRKVRILRDSVLVTETKITSLRRFKDEVNEVPNGLECGVGVEHATAVQENDVIECFTMESVAATL